MDDSNTTDNPLDEKIQQVVDDQQPKRLTQLDYMPGSIKNRHIGEGVNAVRSSNTDIDFSAAAAPSVGQVPTATSTTTVTWQTPVTYIPPTPKRSRVYKDAAQSINSATDTTLSFNQETFDNDTMHDTVTNNSRITITTAGVYLLKAQVAFASNATGYRQGYFLKNGSGAFSYVTLAAANGERTVIQLETIAELAAADYIEVSAKQSSGGALNVEGAASDQYYQTHFEAIRLGSTT